MAKRSSRVDCGVYPFSVVEDLCRHFVCNRSKGNRSHWSYQRFKILSSFTNIIQLPLIYIVFHMVSTLFHVYIALLFGAIMTYSIALYCARTDCNIPARYFILKAILPVSASVLLTLVIAYPCMMAIAVNSISSLVFSVTLTMLIFAVSFYCICCQKEERRILYSYLF